MASQWPYQKSGTISAPEDLARQPRQAVCKHPFPPTYIVPAVVRFLEPFQLSYYGLGLWIDRRHHHRQNESQAKLERRLG